MDNRRFVLALGLSVLVLVIWSMIYRPEPPTTGTPAESPAPESAVSQSRDEGDSLEGSTKPPAESAPPAVTAASEPTASPEEPQVAVAGQRERELVVETPAFRAVFTNRGAQLVSYVLKRYVEGEDQVDLVRRRSEGPYPFALLLPDGDESPLNRVLFKATVGTDDELTFRYRGAEGSATKRFSFLPEGMFEVDFEVRGGGALLLGPGVRNPSVVEKKNRFARRTGVYRTSEDVERVDAGGAKESTIVPGPSVLWAGLADTYFLTGMVPAERFASLAYDPMLVIPDAGEGQRFIAYPVDGSLSDEQKDLEREFRMVWNFAGERFSGRAFFGPKQYDALAALPDGLADAEGLQGAVNLGFFSFLSRPLLAGLQWIHRNLVQNWGWSIILMTIAIRLVLFPLTHKSVVSMQKMQELSPKMQAIRQRYKSKLKDKQGRPNAEMQRKMNEEIMGLYKKEGVNPAGGCLPMLLQLPVLFAFYGLLSTAIELRNAPWMFWITDLSVKDPLYVLPIVMGASQFLQQKMTPSSADPAQRRIFMLMPVFFTVLFLGFPSGLVLYWLTNNVLGIGQQAVYKRIQDKKKAAAKEESKRPKGSKTKETEEKAR